MGYHGQDAARLSNRLERQGYMKIEYAGIGVELERDDYFFVQQDGPNTFKLILTSGNRKPLILHNVTHQQIHSLITQTHKTAVAMWSKRAEDVCGEA